MRSTLHADNPLHVLLADRSGHWPVATIHQSMYAGDRSSDVYQMVLKCFRILDACKW